MLALPVSVGVGDLLVFWGEGLIKEAGSFLLGSDSSKCDWLNRS